MGEGEGGPAWDGLTDIQQVQEDEPMMNPLSELRRELVNGGVYHPLEALEQETAAEKLVFDRMQIEDVVRLGEEQQKARLLDEERARESHKDRLNIVNASKLTSLLRVRADNYKKLEAEKQRFRDAVDRRAVVRHNIDAYFQQSNERLKTFVKTRRTQIMHKYGEMTTTTTHQFKLSKIDWDSIPQQVEVHITSVRGLKDKVPKGDYVVLVSKYSQLGGVPFKWSLRDPSSAVPPPCPLHEDLSDPCRNTCEVCKGWAGSTIPVRHKSTYDSVDLPVDTSIYTFLPPRQTIKPYSAFLFELVRLPQKPSEMPQIVGWSAFPVINGRFSVIKGKFKAPLLRGAVDSRVEHYSRIEKIIAEDIEAWLGNLYFEVVPHPRECEGMGEFDIEARGNAKRLGTEKLQAAAEQRRSTAGHLHKEQSVVVSGMKTLGMSLASMTYIGDSFRNVGKPHTREPSEPSLGGSQCASSEFGSFGGFGRSISKFAPLPALHVDGVAEARRRRSSIAFVEEYGEDDEDEDIQGLGKLQQRHETKRLLRRDRSDESSDDVDSNDASSGVDSEKADGDLTDEQEGGLLFDLIDQDNDGVLSRDEIYQYLVKYPEVKERLKIHSLSEFFEQFDANSDGSICRDEFAAMWAAIASGAADMFGFRDKKRNSEHLSLQGRQRTLGKSFKSFKNVLSPTAGKGRGKLFNALDNLAKAKKKRRVLVERGEKWNQYTPEINDTTFLSAESASWSLQLQYCWRGILDELNLKNPGELKFWFVLLVFVLALYSQLYVHGVGKYIAAFALGVPTSNIEPLWYGLKVQYDSHHTSAFQELFIVLLSMSFNIAVIALLISFSFGLKLATGGLPQQTSKFVYCLSLAYLVFPFLHLGIDLGGGYSQKTSDIVRLIDFYNANKYEPFFGISTFAVLYLNIAAVVGVMNYLYTMRVHLNGILQDCFWRINVVNERNFFIPLDLEVSKKELDHICRKAEMWRGMNGERRKTKVSLLVTTDDTDCDYLSKQMHVEIYTLYPKQDLPPGVQQPRKVFREFYVMTDGAIVEARKSRLPIAVNSVISALQPTKDEATKAIRRKSTVNREI
eukprot:TRINITY_DN38232_c0_g1_i1.p1 TRINITY_DN38232_c0_g1~~TRINITY_DN38232_c0_g1_i1.p1  ORF type:complete len:1083 (+),score=361.75 TRINITY_DN38232_c0_g1_i1:27-3251(+)